MMDKQVYAALRKIGILLGGEFDGNDLPWMQALGKTFSIKLDDEYPGFHVCPICQSAVPMRTFAIRKGGLSAIVWEVDIHTAIYSRSYLDGVSLITTKADQETLVQIFVGTD